MIAVELSLGKKPQRTGDKAVEYQIKSRGEVVDTTDDKATALMAVRTYPAEWSPQVIAHEVSGTHESWTCIWPVLGETYAK